MALQNHPALYTGGGERFNSQPYVNFYAHLMARKQAKEDALEKYYQDLPKGINSAGVRTQDIPLFMQKVDGMGEYYRQNREAIKNPRIDNGEAQTRYGSMYQDAKLFPQMSKFEEEKKKPWVEMGTNPTIRDRMPDSIFQNDIPLHDLPLGHPDRKSLDLSKFDFNPKDFEVDKFKKLFENIKPDEEKIYGVTDPKTLKMPFTTKHSYNKEAKGSIYDIAAASYRSDPSVQAEIHKAAEDKKLYAKFNDVFKKTYGEDIESPEDFAAAYAISLIQPEQNKGGFEDDRIAFMKLQDEYARKRMRLQDNLIRGRMATSAAQYDTWVGDYLDILDEQALTNEPGLLPGADSQVYEIPIDPVMAKALDRTGKGRTPQKLYISKEGTYYPVYYEYSDGVLETEEDGRPKIDEDESVPLNRQQMVLSLGGKAVTKTQIGKEVKDAKEIKSRPPLDSFRTK